MTRDDLGTYAVAMKTKNQVPQDDSISVAGIQFEQAEGNREANLSQATEIIAAHSGHDIYVLPELSSSGYGFFQLGTRQR
ncbi:MAG: hypothetical protein K9J81_12025 [Desulfohalobiaceae bacterium]|nr:hypothetical protein [Desulfohalobiaceae bacterium]